MRITAHHAHLFPTQVRPAGDIAHLLSTLDACGIEQCVAFAPFPAQMHRQDISPSRWLHDEIVPHGDRLFGFGVIDFARGHLQEQVDEIASLGFKGIKLHPAFQHFNVFGPEARQVYARAEELGLFLSFQYPVEIPGVSMVNFMRAAVNEKRKYFNLPPLSASEFLKLMREKRAVVELDNKLASRSVNEGFSGGEKKRNEILQMAMLLPKYSFLDETDSGLDIDALRIVSNGINHLHNQNRAVILVTHYERILDLVKPDFIHVLMHGKILMSGGPELALKLEKDGYDWIEGA